MAPGLRAGNRGLDCAANDQLTNTMKTLEVTVYEFDELNDKAKERAREWYLRGAFDYEWWDSTYGDAARIGLEIRSFDLDGRRHATGRLTKDATTVADLIIAEHGPDCETTKDALAFWREHDALVESAERDECGELADTYALDEKLDELEGEFLKTLLEDYSILLQKESEFMQSEEYIDDNIRANGYTFTGDGEREG
jgi:Zn ribbon nucleic-acid-binding protein